MLKNTFLKSFLAGIILCSGIFAQAQFIANTKQTFNAAGSFIENIGQYGSNYKGQENMGEILFGFEGHDMPILFTKKGLLFLQRKVEKISKAEEEKLEKQGVNEEEIEHKKIVIDRAITMQWLGANSNVEIIQEEKTYDYHTYGLIKEKAYGYKKIIYKNLYKGVDLVYSFINNSKIGFEYSLHVAAGADISQIKMRYGGDVKKINTNKQGNLVIASDIDGIEETIPVSYYAKSTTDKIKTNFAIAKNEISFYFKESYDNTKPIIIDPFISNASNLNGVNAGKAKDIDFDYAGNVYVTGGGNVATNHRLAKYNAAGVLQWTFNGVLTNPIWQFGANLGGWVVQKTTGNVYLGQGVILNGFTVLRLSAIGLYDNYITSPDVNFWENWKMIWNCNNGNAQILIAGGGISSNVNLGVLSPPSASLTGVNITGILFTPPSEGAAQDIVDIQIDPANNDMYTIFASLEGLVDNKIYKNSSPYTPASILWNILSGFLTMFETRNRPYLVADFGTTDNSANIFSINPTYLFYWDGKNLKAFNKVTGAAVGTPLITNNTAKMSGGIYADACNNVYVGSINGTIKAYNFNGSNFSDTPADITIAGYPTKSIYDIAYNEAENLLYVSGDGFVAAYDISTTCSTNSAGFRLNIVTNCSTASATANLVPAPPTGSVVTYSLFIGSTQIASNTTGIFTGLLLITNYKITATINQACSGIRVAGNFIIPGSALPIVTPTITYCQGTIATALTAAGTNLLWYTAATGGTGTITAPIPTTAAVGTTAYYVSQTTAGNCESPRAQINVQVTTPLSAPIVTTPITYCQGANATALTATGINLLWYTSATGGIGSTTAPMPNTAVVGSTTYYVSQTVGTCESARANIIVTVSAAPTITIQPQDITACTTTATFTVTATGTNLTYQWFLSIDGGTTYNAIIGATATAFTINGLTPAQVNNKYRVSVFSGTCSTVISNSVTAKAGINPVVLLAATPTVNFNPYTNGGLDVRVTPAGNYTYQWKRNNVVLSNTGITITKANGLLFDFGNYIVTAIDNVTGCIGTSNTVAVSDIEGARGELFIYPNPSNGILNISFYSKTTAAQNYKVNVYDAKGARVLTNGITLSGIYGFAVVNISSFAKGDYIVTLINATGKKLASKKVIKY